MTTNRDYTRVELWVRELAPTGIGERQHSIYERLRELERSGDVDTLECDAWGKYARPPTGRITGDLDTPVTETLREFVEWAHDSGVSLTPAFERRTTSSIGSAVERPVFVLPLMSLAIYEGEDLAWVYPHRHEDGDEVCTVEDGVAALETSDPDEVPAQVPAGH